MKIAALNTTNFTSKTQSTNEGRKRYFEYLSKNSANEALMMSKGREEEDGKFKLAQTLTGSGAFASGVGAAFMCSKLVNQYAQNYDPKTGVANFAQEAGKKFIRNNKIMGGLIVGALTLGAACLAIRDINRTNAEKTANERGFFTLQDRMKMKNAKEVYQAAEETYDKHVKQ